MRLFILNEVRILQAILFTTLLVSHLILRYGGLGENRSLHHVLWPESLYVSNVLRMVLYVILPLILGMPAPADLPAVAEEFVGEDALPMLRLAAAAASATAALARREGLYFDHRRSY